MVHNAVDLTGKVFGLLTVIGLGEPRPRADRPGENTRTWVCKCECGNIKTYTSEKFRKHPVPCCGCTTKQKIVDHGHCVGKSSITYSSWVHMQTRCGSSREEYKRYKNVKIHSSWLGKDGFKNFLADMGERPSAEYSLDRIDSKGDYTPDNCRWATRKEQNRNMSSNKVITYNGKTQCQAAWAEEYNMSYRTLVGRLTNGWTIEEALSIPYRGRRKND